MADTLCPLCGSIVQTKKPLVDLNTNTISFRGKIVQVQAKIAELASILIDAAPNRVHVERLMYRLYGASSPSSDNIIRVYMRSLRRAVKPLGVQIDVIRGYGYRVVL